MEDKLPIRSIIIICFILLISSCNGSDQIDHGREMFGGKHLLRQFKIKNTTLNQWSASYFLIAGSASGSITSETKISFAWQANSGEYIMSELNRGQIRIDIDDNIETPYITFSWNENKLDGYKHIDSNIENIIFFYVYYIVVHCHPDDFPSELEITEL